MATAKGRKLATQPSPPSPSLRHGAQREEKVGTHRGRGAMVRRPAIREMGGGVGGGGLRTWSLAQETAPCSFGDAHLQGGAGTRAHLVRHTGAVGACARATARAPCAGRAGSPLGALQGRKDGAAATRCPYRRRGCATLNSSTPRPCNPPTDRSTLWSDTQGRSEPVSGMRCSYSARSGTGSKVRTAPHRRVPHDEHDGGATTSPLAGG